MRSLLLFLGMIFFGTMAMAQTSVSGQLTDEETGEPLIGANVFAKGTTTGTLTDYEGKYSFTVPEGTSILVYSYTGYKSKEIAINGQTEINIALGFGADLDEVIVVGYQEKKKSDLTGSVAVVDLDEMGKSAYTNVLQSLQGRVSGVNITQDGQPGSGRTSIRIRGISTWTNNNPLYVVDGVPTEENLDNLNPNDIESIQVLKDAAAASIYGSRSGAGVVVITTKKGRKGKLSVDAGVLNGVQTIGNQIETLNATQWGEVYWTAFENTFPNTTPSHPQYGTGATPVISTTPFLVSNGRQIYTYSEEGTNWADEVYQDALQQSYYMNISNGNEKGSVMFGASYFNQQGLIKHTGYDRLTTRLNSEYKFTDWLKVGENFSVSYSDQVQIGSQQGQDGIPTDVLRQHPLLPVYAFDSTYAGKLGGFPDVRNMVSVLEKNRNNNTESWRVFGNVYIEANLLDAFALLRERHDLKFKSNLGVDYSNYYDTRFNAAFQEGDFDVTGNLLFNSFGKGLTTTWINTLEYGYNVGDHRVTVLAGTESIAYDFSFINATRTDFEIESPNFTYLSAGAGTQTNAGGGTQWGLLSYFGRADYVFSDKYLASATVRYDKTSRLNTSGIFPAASLGWNFTNEDFMKDLLGEKGQKILTNAKLRLSYGQQGIQSVSDFATLSIFGADVNHADYDIMGSNNDVSQGYRVLTKGNPNLRWETITQYNAGLDINLFDYKMNVGFDVFIKNTQDVLLQPPLLAALGEGDVPFENIGEVRNEGFDLNIGYNHQSAKEDGLNWGATLQVTKFNNTVVSLGDGFVAVGNDGEEYISFGNSRLAEGYPIGTFYGWQVEGIFQTEEEALNAADQNGANAPGRLRYADLNGDTIINDLDRTYLGSPYPDLSLGLNLNADFKGFTLDLFFYSAIGQSVYNENKIYMDFTQFGNFNRSTRILDAWSTTNTSSMIPAPTLDNANDEGRASSYFVEDASYLKLRTARLGYTLPAKWTKGYNVNLYTEVQNVFSIDNYSGVDPEVPYADNANFIGIDRGVYPLPRTFLLGINVRNL